MRKDLEQELVVDKVNLLNTSAPSICGDNLKQEGINPTIHFPVLFSINCFIICLEGKVDGNWVAGLAFYTYMVGDNTKGL